LTTPTRVQIRNTHLSARQRDKANSDPSAIVDAWGLMRDVEALRVVDASILPEIPSVPTNVTTIMVAERIGAKLSA